LYGGAEIHPYLAAGEKLDNNAAGQGALEAHSGQVPADYLRKSELLLFMVAMGNPSLYVPVG